MISPVRVIVVALLYRTFRARLLVFVDWTYMLPVTAKLVAFIYIMASPPVYAELLNVTLTKLKDVPGIRDQLLVLQSNTTMLLAGDVHVPVPERENP